MEEIIEAPQTDFYIVLPSEDDLPTAFAAFYRQDTIKTTDEEGNVTEELDGESYLVMNTHDYAIDVVGTLYEPTGQTTTVEGMETPVMAPINGYHVNVRLVGNEAREAVEAINATYGVKPNSPSRVFA